MTLISCTHIYSYTNEEKGMYQFLGQNFKSFHEILCSNIFSIFDLAVKKVKVNPTRSTQGHPLK